MRPDTNPSLRRPSDTPLPRRIRLITDLARVPLDRLVVVSLIGLGVMLGVSTVLRARQVIAELGPTTLVPIARGPIEAGTVLQADDIEWQHWPQALAPPGATRVQIGDYARATIAPGEPILASVTGSADDRARHERFVSIPVETDTAAFRTGDHIELHGITMANTDQGAPQVQLIDLGSARVVHVSPTHVQIAIDREMVPRLLHTQAVGVVELIGVPTP